MTEYERIHERRFEILRRYIIQLGLPRTAAVLDIGCYPPVMLDWLRRRFNDVSGLCSRHERMLDAKIRQANLDTDRLPFLDNSFDLVLFSEVLEHLLGHPRLVLAECARVLRPGGKLLITTPNAVALKRRLTVLTGKPTGPALAQLPDLKKQPDAVYHIHHKEYTQAELRELFQAETLLSLERVELVSFYTPGRRRVREQPIGVQILKIGAYALEQVYPPFRDSLLALATKP